uniref:Uncharacterized protein n=1 Tax=Opuntia streptacantha TaxID=393608 RepID=A0A7C8ZP21_OPUST
MHSTLLALITKIEQKEKKTRLLRLCGEDLSHLVQRHRFSPVYFLRTITPRMDSDLKLIMCLILFRMILFYLTIMFKSESMTLLLLPDHRSFLWRELYPR